jgi:membrane fusion protein, multidrug efflux system
MPEAAPNTNIPRNSTDSAPANDTTTFPPASPQATKSAHGAQPGGARRSGGHRHWVLWLFVLILVVGGYVVYRRREAEAQAAKAAASQVQKSIPVTTATATKGDIGVYVDAIATVTPIYTVNEIARVQGEIVAINYREGQLVKKGDPLIDIDPKPFQAALTQAEGQLAHDEALLSEARIDLSRYQAALSRNAIAQQQVADQQQIVLQDEGQVKNDQGVVEAAQTNLGYCHITSPIDGRVGLRLVDLGNMVQANSTTTLVVITQLQPITLEFSVSQKYLPQIQQQMKAGHQMAVDALDTDSAKKLASGYIETTDNEVDPTTDTIRLRALFQNENLTLFPQAFVNARLQLDTLRGATLIPNQAIQMNSQTGSFVYVANANETASVRTITQGTTDNYVTSVTGINPGDVVITSGFNNLSDGSKISVHNGNQNTSGSAAAATNSQGNKSPASNAANKGKGGSSKPSGGGSNSGNHE